MVATHMESSGVGERLRTPARRRLPELILAAVFIALGALVGLWWWSESANQVPILVAARDVPLGEEITAADVRIVNVAAESSLATLSPDAEGSLVGRSAAVQIEAGTPWSESLLVASAGVPDGLAVVGAVLEPGGYPMGELADGDVVDVLVVPERREERAPAVLVERAEVFRVEALDDQREQLLVSLLVPTAQRVEVAGAAAAGELMLVAGS